MDFSVLGISREDLLDKIVENVSENLLGDEERIGVNVSRVIHERVDKSVMKALADAVPKRVDDILERALGVQYTPINNWGEPVGAPQTIREVMLNQARSYMEQPVNINGAPINPGAYSSTPTMSRLQWHVAQAVKDAMNKEMRGVLEQMKADYSQKLREAVGTAMAKFIHDSMK